MMNATVKSLEKMGIGASKDGRYWLRDDRDVFLVFGISIERDCNCRIIRASHNGRRMHLASNECYCYDKGGGHWYKSRANGAFEPIGEAMWDLCRI